MRNRLGGAIGWLAAAGLAAGAARAADWAEPDAGGAPVASFAAPSAAALSPDRVLVAGVREDAGVARVFLAQSEGGSWTAANGGEPADGAAPGPVRAPRLTAANGGAYLLFARHDGISAWRLYARFFDGVAMSDVDDGRSVDESVPAGTIGAFAAVAVAGGEFHVLFTHFDGSRMALRAAWCAGGNWQQADDGLAVDLGGDGWSDAPATAPDGAGGAVAAYTQETPTGRRLFVLRLAGPWLGRSWERLDGGAPVDRADLGNVSGPAVTVLADGRILVAYLQEDGAGVPRLFGLVRDGATWVRLNGGEPIDAAPGGVADVAVTPAAAGAALVSYLAADGGRLYALEVRGLAVSPMNGGEALEAPGGGTGGFDLASAGAAGWLVWEQPAGAVRARRLGVPPAPAAAAGPVAGPTDGLVVTRAVFRPGAGERTELAWTAGTPQRIRVSIHSIAGEPVMVLADGPAAGRTAVEWDGRDAAGRGVAPGVYVVRAAGETFRQSAKLVVVR